MVWVALRLTAVTVPLIVPAAHPPERIPEALHHRLREREPGVGDDTAAAHAVPGGVPRGRRLGARAQLARGAQDELAEVDDRDVRGPEVLARAVRDEALAVLDHGVLLGHALDAGERAALLIDAIDEVVVVAVAHRHPVRVDLGVHAAPGPEARTLGVGE
jgi:hypothetical protein